MTVRQILINNPTGRVDDMHFEISIASDPLKHVKRMCDFIYAWVDEGYEWYVFVWGKEMSLEEAEVWAKAVIYAWKKQNAAQN